MSALDRLAEIEQRAEAHHMAAGGVEVDGDPYFSMANWKWTGKPHRLVYDLAGDNRGLVAALRAVLDLHEPFGSDPGICAGCEDYAPCPTVRAITKALGGGA